ncbi:MAG: ATP-binding protein [Proteobacteria bacterium]|nr:ATP-binding protein [Pseudomonadota bacterium]
MRLIRKQTMDIQELISGNLDKILNLWLIIDKNSQIVHCSNPASHHLGYSREELQNQSFLRLLPENEPNRDTFINDLIARAYQGTVVDEPVQFKLKNDVIINVKLSMHLLEHQGEEFKLIIFDDVTELMELRKMLNTRTELLRKKFRLFDKDFIIKSISDIVQAVLVSITAGQGLRFNRAFLFFVDREEKVLKGIQAIGPDSGEEAGMIYSLFDRAPKTLTEMIEHYRLLEDTDSTVNAIVKNIRISLDDSSNILIRVLNNQKHLLINDESPLVGDTSVNWLRNTLQVHECIVVPLIWHGRSTGLIIADNVVTKVPISNLDIKDLSRFATEASTAIESSKLLSNLDRSIMQIRQANMKIKASQTMLLQKEKLAAMGELVAHMAHEVRGPLATIGGFASRVRKQLNEDDKHYESISRIVDTVGTLELVINDILDGSLPVKEDTEGCDCTKAINKVLALLEEEIHKRKISVNLNIQGNLPKISIKEHHLFEIINNLVKNALEAIEQQGLLLILAGTIDHKVVITIQDTGSGIAPASEEKIFSPFFTTKEKGTGLGLVVVKKLVEDNDGTIDIRSIPEKGTTFIISFPIDDLGDQYEQQEDFASN